MIFDAEKDLSAIPSFHIFFHNCLDQYIFLMMSFYHDLLKSLKHLV